MAATAHDLRLAQRGVLIIEPLKTPTLRSSYKVSSPFNINKLVVEVKRKSCFIFYNFCLKKIPFFAKVYLFGHPR